MWNRLRNLEDLSIEELILLEEALTQEIIRADRSGLIGDLAKNRLRMSLRTRLGCNRLRRLKKCK